MVRRATDVSGESPPNRPVGEIEPLVDEEILNGLRKWLDEADLREVLTRVPEEAERCFDAIEAAIVAGDLTAAGKAAHGLAGMAANVGAKRLAAIAGGIANGMPTLEAVAGQMSALDHALKGTGAVLRSMT